MTPRPCTVEGCHRPLRSRGVCTTHYMRQRTRGLAYGTWEVRHVDAHPVREHIANLRAAGIGNRRLSELSGVAKNTIQVTMTGRPTRGSGPSAKMLRETAEKILAVEIPERPHDGVAAGAVVPALGTTRRLQALVASGYTQRYLAGQIGCWDGGASKLFRGEAPTVLARTARAVEELFNRLQMIPGPDSRSRARGRAKGWPLPMDWDEDRIDDPEHRPIRFTATEVSQARKRERRDEVARLTQLGCNAREIARRLGVTERTVVRDRGEVDLKVGA